MKHLFNIATSTLASTIRSWRGTSSSKTVGQPDHLPVLFDREGCPECRIVREAITELNLDVIIAPCPKGGRDIKRLKLESGSNEIPRLYDPNTEKNLSGQKAIVDYLFSEYRGIPVPKQLESNLVNNARSKIASLVRFNAGTCAIPSRQAAEPLTLYSFESSPFCRPVREKLCELELPYKLINLGKQQWADMGPANFHFTIGKYKPLENTKRYEFFKLHGNVQVPYLIDPNTNTQMFESAEILKYLQTTYGA